MIEKCPMWSHNALVNNIDSAFFDQIYIYFLIIHILNPALGRDQTCLGRYTVIYPSLHLGKTKALKQSHTM